MKKKTMLIEVTSFADDEEILKMISVGKLCRKKDALLLEWEKGKNVFRFALRRFLFFRRKQPVIPSVTSKTN